MEKKPVQAAARTLRVLVTLAFVLGLLAVGFSPVLAGIHGAGIPLPELMDSLTAAPPPPGEDWPYFSPSMLLFFAVAGGWTERFSYTLVLTLFLAAAGLVRSRKLWQGGGCLAMFWRGSPFTRTMPAACAGPPGSALGSPPRRSPGWCGACFPAPVPSLCALTQPCLYRPS